MGKKVNSLCNDTQGGRLGRLQLFGLKISPQFLGYFHRLTMSILVSLPIYWQRTINMTSETQTSTNQYKRTSRHPSDQTRERISQALRGRPKSEPHKAAIQASLQSYWADDDNFPDDSRRDDTMWP